jgi:hypothetical protein
VKIEKLEVIFSRCADVTAIQELNSFHPEAPDEN